MYVIVFIGTCKVWTEALLVFFQIYVIEVSTNISRFHFYFKEFYLIFIIITSLLKIQFDLTTNRLGLMLRFLAFSRNNNYRYLPGFTLSIYPNCESLKFK